MQADTKEAVSTYTMQSVLKMGYYNKAKIKCIYLAPKNHDIEASNRTSGVKSEFPTVQNFLVVLTELAMVVAYY